MPQRTAAHKIVHITTVPSTLIFLEGQGRYMHENGFEVEAISSPGHHLDDFGTDEQAATHTVSMSRQITPLRDLRSLWALYRLLRRLRPTIVHAHTPKAGLLGSVAAWMARVPVRLYHIHGLPLTTATGYRRGLLVLCERISCCAAQRVLCVSQSIRQVALDAGLCPPSKITVPAGGSANGVAAQDLFNPASYPPGTRAKIRRRLGIPENAPVLGFIGRLVGDKGVVQLVAAFQQLVSEEPTLRLMVIGGFEQRDAIPDDVRETLTGHPNIHVVGQLPHGDMPLYYLAMDVLALPSYREGMPYAPLEASAMSLPVVATRVPGCVDVVEDKVTGVLVPVRDTHSLAEAIRAYLASPELRREHGHAGRERVLREFRPEGVWQAILDEYRALLQARGLPEPAALEPCRQGDNDSPRA